MSILEQLLLYEEKQSSVSFSEKVRAMSNEEYAEWSCTALVKSLCGIRKGSYAAERLSKATLDLSSHFAITSREEAYSLLETIIEAAVSIAAEPPTTDTSPEKNRKRPPPRECRQAIKALRKIYPDGDPIEQGEISKSVIRRIKEATSHEIKLARSLALETSFTDALLNLA